MTPTPEECGGPSETCFGIISRMHHSLGRIEAKLDTVSEDVQDVASSQKKLDKRVSSLESTRTYLRGIYAAIVGTWGLIAYYLFK